MWCDVAASSVKKGAVGPQSVITRLLTLVLTEVDVADKTAQFKSDFSPQFGWSQASATLVKSVKFPLFLSSVLISKLLLNTLILVSLTLMAVAPG